MLRILLFMGTNIAVLLVLTLVMKVLGIDRYLAMQGGSYISLLIYSFAFGMVGSLISLFMSKSMAKRSMGVQLIEQPQSAEEQWIYSTVENLAKKANIGMPEVGIFHSSSPNAFATGWNKNSALVAVSTGLLENMNRDEVEAVLGHEIGHVANGDMITLTLIQGVLNAFVIFFARIVGQIVDRAIFKNERGYGFGFMAVNMLAQFVFGILASIIVKWFSRYREYRADIAGAELVNPAAMVSALERLNGNTVDADIPDEMVAFGISSGVRKQLGSLMATHPPLEQRILALKERYKV